VRTTSQIKINFIRHGKTPLNEKHCYVGITDESLSAAGAYEIVKKKEAGIYPPVKRVFVSPLKRAKETAAIIYNDVPFVEIDEFKETDFGSFEGKNYEELKDNPYYRKWIDESRGASEDEIEKLYGKVLSNADSQCSEKIILPENKEDFSKRVIAGFLKVLRESRGLDEISIVAHGGTIMAIASAFCDSNYYDMMCTCGEGIGAEVTFIADDENITVSCFSINNRIRS